MAVRLTRHPTMRRAKTSMTKGEGLLATGPRARPERDKPLPGRDVGEITDPQHIRRGRVELAVHFVQWARQRLVRHCCLRFRATDNTFNADVFHQSDNGTARYIKSFPAHLVPDLSNAIDAEVFLKDTLDFRVQFFVTFGAIGKA